MGSSCKKPAKEEKNQYSIRLYKSPEYFGDIQFNFTTEKITRINCECLILFTDLNLKIKKNKYLNFVSAHAAAKMQQYLDVNLIQSQLEIGKAIIFQIEISEFTFDYVCVVCLRVWEGANVKQPLFLALKNTFALVKQAGISKIAITQIDEQYGIPVEVAYNCISWALYQQRQDIKSVAYLCDTVTDQNQVNSAIQNFRPNKQNPRVTIVTEEESIYY